MVIRDVCPRCQSPHYKKNGRIHNGKQNHQCKDCGRQFVECFEQYLVSEETRALIERLLMERISLRGICRAVGITLKWLLGFLVQCIAALPDHLHVQPVRGTQAVMIQRLEVEADEIASFVKKKANKQWIWIAMDATSRQVIAFSRGRSQPQKCPAAVEQDSAGVPSTRHILHRSACGVYRGDSGCPAPSHQQVSPENQSHRAVQ